MVHKTALAALAPFFPLTAAAAAVVVLLAATVEVGTAALAAAEVRFRMAGMVLRATLVVPAALVTAAAPAAAAVGAAAAVVVVVVGLVGCNILVVVVVVAPPISVRRSLVRMEAGTGRYLFLLLMDRGRLYWLLGQGTLPASPAPSP